MNDLRAAKISKFRDKHERQIVSIMAQAITCSSCMVEGNGTLLRTEMDSLTDQILNLVEQERKVARKKPVAAARGDAVIVALKGVAT